MKKAKIYLVLAIIWMIVAFLFFNINKIGVGMTWLIVGVINLIYSILTYQYNKKVQAVVDALNKMGNIEDEDEEENYNQQERIVEPIVLSEEVHTIYDEYIGYGYVVNKAFKPAKSHAAEGDLLCTYAPDDEYGKEGDVPYIAVQIDDKVYCAVAEYKESGTFGGAISVEPLEGKFLFRAKRKYFGDMMYFYGFELDDEEFWDMAGLCLVYPKEYIGTEDEEKLMHTLDEAAKSFQKDIHSVRTS